MTDIRRIISLIDIYFETNGINRATANEISLYLEKCGVLSHSTKGQPLRELLRAGMIPNAEQPGGKGTPWYIRHSTDNQKFGSLGITKSQRDEAKFPSTIAFTNGLSPVADLDSEILILGTLPGKASLRTKQYYANRGNQFWAIISGLFNETMPVTYQDRLNFLKRHHIALWDVLRSANRAGSLDADITDPVANDITGFILAHPKLRVIGLNGKKATDYFWTYVNLQKLPEGFRIVSLPSTSPRNYHMPLEAKKNLWAAIL